MTTPLMGRRPAERPTVWEGLLGDGQASLQTGLGKGGGKVSPILGPQVACLGMKKLRNLKSSKRFGGEVGGKTAYCLT